MVRRLVQLVVLFLISLEVIVEKRTRAKLKKILYYKDVH